MRMRKTILYLFLGLGLFGSNNKTFAQTDTIPGNFCISSQEYQLYQLINDYRKAHSLAPLALSKSLSYVAKTHTHDLAMNYKSGTTCNMHSWSDKGRWTPICFPSEQSKKNNVWLKAKEIVGYPSEAREITYWSNTENEASQIVEFWSENKASADLLLNQNEWVSVSWKAMGIGMEDGYAVLLLGKAIDTELSTPVCGKETKVLNINSPEYVASHAKESANQSPVYFITIASFSEMEDAANAVKSYKEMGYPKAVYIEADNKIRVAIDYFTDKKEADQALKKYAQKFKGAWVLTI